MSKKKELDIEEEVERLSRRTKTNVIKSEYSFNKQIKRLDNEIDRVLNDKIKQFDDDKDLAQKYMSIEFNHDTIDRYREKLRKM